MDIRNTKEGAELILELNKVGSYETHKELWDAYYKVEDMVKTAPISNDVGQDNCSPCSMCSDYGAIDSQDGTISTCSCHY